MRQWLRSITAYEALLVFAFAAGCSMPLARAALVVALALTIRDAVRGTVCVRWSAPARAWLAYFAVAVIVTALVWASLPEGALIQPGRGLGKTTKLLWYVGAVLLPPYVASRERFHRIVAAFVFGSAVYAACIVVLHPLAAWVQMTLPMPGDPDPAVESVAARLRSLTDALGLTECLQKWTMEPWRARSFNVALGKLSGMGSAQRLMAGALAALGLALEVRPFARSPVRQTELENRKTGKPENRIAASGAWWCLTAVIVAGLVVTLKRGSLLVFLLVGGGMALRRIGWKRGLLVVAAVVALAVALPASRARLAEIPDEFRFSKGGRVLMWTDLAPAMRKKYPWGVGFRGLTYESLRYATENGWRMELGQNHLHSNPIQVTVELGWLGLAVYLVWMGLALRSAARGARDPLQAVPLLLLAGLFLNGLVEYNLADGEVTLLYGLAMGLAVALPPRQPEDSGVQ